MALKFKVGDRVLDLATGTRGAVYATSRALGRDQEMYSIQLADGRFVWRGVDELALDQAIAPAPEK